MIRSGDLQEHHREVILHQFEQEVLHNFRDMDPPNKPMKVTAKKIAYNCVYECYKFRAVDFKLIGGDDSSFVEHADNCTIVSVDAKNNQIEKTKEDRTRVTGKKKKKGGKW